MLGQPSINAIVAIVSTPHLAMKFLEDDDSIVTIHTDQKAARECYMASLKCTPIQEVQRAQAVNVVTWVRMDMTKALDLDPRIEED